jgi:chitosanase
MDKNIDLIKRILTCFEQSSQTIKYDKIYMWNDGPSVEGKRIKQITVSFGITEWGGSLKKLINEYSQQKGIYSSTLSKYASQLEVKSLITEKEFVDTLSTAGREDIIMQKCQDKIFIETYIQPALAWCDKNKLTLPLSKLVVADSFLHSGGILPFLRNRFAESVPSNGGDEKKWIQEYCRVRRDWLKTHENKILNNTVYRVDFMQTQVINDNWNLEKFPVIANGVKIIS